MQARGVAVSVQGEDLGQGVSAASKCIIGADQPLSPIRHSRFGAVPLGHLGRVGLNLVAAILAPNDQPDAGGGSISERHR
jgi:hypothetical protein